jgi:hypothetical protein
MSITIIVKNKDGGNRKASYKEFYGPLDKGSAKPSFCYPRAKDSLKEDVESMHKALENGYIDKGKEMQVRADLKMKEKRLNDIDAQEGKAKELFKENQEAWMKRREALAEEIREGMPSATDVTKKRVNPYRIHENEKKKGLGEKKLEYQVLSHLAGEESNTGYLQRD